MAKDLTKAIGNVWAEARKDAAKYNDTLYSREGAAQALNVHPTTLASYELGTCKNIPVDMAIMMADLYKKPELLNHYCKHECPIGCNLNLSCDVYDIDRLTVKLLSESKHLNELKDKLLEIAADGSVSVEEQDDFYKIEKELNELAETISEIKIFGERIRNGRYYDEQSG